MKDNAPAKKILIVDDEPDILEFLQYNLKKEGFAVVTAGDGKQALLVAEREKPDLIILDIMMPELDGVETCRILRSRKEFMLTPVAFLTARDEDFTQITALDTGGDDYITKPFSMEELIFRIEAILRRVSQDNNSHEDAIYKLGIYTFDSRKQILIGGEEGEIKLTTKESELLRLLCNNANKVLERNFALKTIWIDDNYFNARSMDVYITKLRKHLKDDPKVEIINVHGKGYKLIL